MSDAVVVNAYSGSLSSHFPIARSASATPYGESSITLEYDDVYKDVAYKAHKYTWVNRLLGIVCAKTSKEKQTIMNQTSMQPRPETYASSSPWILPVYVLSTRQDKDKHHIAIEAKCTIDTGNMQGNIVSRRFVEDVLEYPKSAFCSLTKEEEVGATGITGHQLIPEAAIYLTWYHKKSIRVFRDMRFLISPSQHFDIIIGAESIQKDGLLSVPNFAIHPRTDLEHINIDEILESQDLKQNITREIENRRDSLVRDIDEAKDVDDTKKAQELEVEKQKLNKVIDYLVTGGHKLMDKFLDKSINSTEKKAVWEEVVKEINVPPPPYEKANPGSKNS